MLAKGSLPGSYNLQSFTQLISRYRTGQSSYYLSQRHRLSYSAVTRLHHGYPMHQGLRLVSTSSGNWTKVDPNLVKDVNVRTTAPAAPARAKFPAWVRWALGTLLSLVLPFWKQKWQTIRRIEGEVETAAEVVEKVATMAEKVSAEVAEKFPEDGKLKQTVLMVEHISKEAAHDAQLTEDFINKVDVLKQDFSDLERTVPHVHLCTCPFKVMLEEHLCVI